MIRPDFSDVFAGFDELDNITPRKGTPAQNHGVSQDEGQETENELQVKPIEAQEFSTGVEAVGERVTPKEKQAQGQEQGTNVLFDELLRNYDRAVYIPPPERVGIFVRGYVNILAGKGGIGKSWQVIRWARDLSTGGECFGGVVKNEPARKVLIIAGELPKREMERRCRLLEEGDGRERTFDNFSIIDLKESEAKKLSFMLDDDTGRKNLESLIAYISPEIIFLDSFISFFNGDEKDSKDVNAVMQFLERLAAQYSLAVVVIHHIRKRLSREQAMPIDTDDVIGSSVFNRRSGFMFASEKLQDGQVQVKEIKSWLQKTKPFSFKVKSGFYEQGVVMDVTPNIEETQPQQNAIKNSPDWKKLVLLFLKGRGQDGATVSEINEAIGRGEEENNKTGGQIGRMEKTGEVQRIGRGRYKLPDEEITISEADDLEQENSQLEFLE